MSGWKRWQERKRFAFLSSHRHPVPLSCQNISLGMSWQPLPNELWTWPWPMVQRCNGSLSRKLEAVRQWSLEVLTSWGRQGTPGAALVVERKDNPKTKKSPDFPSFNQTRDSRNLVAPIRFIIQKSPVENLLRIFENFLKNMKVLTSGFRMCLSVPRNLSRS